MLDIHDSGSKLHIISGGTKVVQHSSPEKSPMKRELYTTIVLIVATLTVQLQMVGVCVTY